jgi:WD40 repeat protein
VPKITDFGLARQLDGPDGRTRTGALVGTPNYMAPEQAEGRGRDVNVATDVWALGCILHECLAGRPPFAADAPLATLQRILYDSPTPLRQARPDAPRDLETIALKCLEKQPSRRYDSAAALARDLRAWLDGRPIQARRHSALERLALWARREPRLAAVSALAALALLALPALFVWFSMRGGLLAREAELHRFYRLLFELKERQARGEPGWSWDNLRDLREAISLPGAAEHWGDLRSLAAACLTATDVRLEATLAEGFKESLAQFSSDGRLLAVMESIGERPEPLRVRLFDAKTLAELPGLYFPSNVAFQTSRNRAERALTAAFSPDSRWLVIGMRSGQMHALDVRGEVATASWQAHAEDVNHLVFAPGGAELHSLDKKGQLGRWAVGGKWPRLPVADVPKLLDLTVAPGVAVLALPENRRLQRVEGGRLIDLDYGLHGGALSAAVGPDGRTIVSHRDSGTAVSDLVAPVLFGLLPEGEKCEQGDAITFSPDGRLVARPCRVQSCVRLWDLAGLGLERSFFVPGLRHGLVFSPDGRRLVATALNRTFVYELANNEVRTAVTPHGGTIQDVTFSADGATLACHSLVSSPRRGYEVTLWPASDDYRARPLHLTRLQPGMGTGFRVAVHPRRPVLYYNWHERIHARDASGTTVVELGPFPRHGGIGCGPDGRLWLACHHDVRQGKDQQQTLRTVWQNPPPDESAGHTFYSIDVNRRWAVAGRRDGRVHVFRADDGGLETSWPACRSPVTAIALAPNERSALVGGDYGEVLHVAIPSGVVLHELPSHAGEVSGVGWVRPDVVVTGSRDKYVRLMTAQGDPLLTLTIDKPVERLAVSPDGARLAVVAENDRGVRMWRLDRLGRRLRELGLDGPLADLPVPAETKPAQVPPPGKGNVVREVFGDTSWLYPLARRNDTHIDFRLSNQEQPLDPALGRAWYSVRWTGRLLLPEPGDYELVLQHDDLARLWIDGQLLQPKAAGQPTVYALRLAAGPHMVRVDYRHGGAVARCTLRWRRPGRALEVIPATAFVPAE